MADASELVRAIKRTSVDAVNASKPVEACFGKVVGVSPLRILVEQKLTLGEAQLVLCRNVCDFSVTVGSENAESVESVDVHNGLKVGEQVILLRQQGGQRYIVWDRIG